MAGKVVRLAAIGGAAREVAEMKTSLIRRLRREDVRGIGIVLVIGSAGEVTTGFAGHKAGQFHTLQSGARILADRIGEFRDK